MDKKILADHIDEIENLRDMINHYLGGIQLHLDQMKRILNEPTIELGLKSKPLPSPVPLENQKDRYLNEKEASEISGISLSTLRNYRSIHKGIPYIKIGKSVRYKLSEIIAFMDAHKINPYPLG